MTLRSMTASHTLPVPVLGVLVLGLVACDSGAEPPQPTTLQLPIEGSAYVDWYYGVLPNHAGTWDGTEDYACGTKTRSFNHTTDFLLPSLQAMKDGVDVLAAAAGEIALVRDGLYDERLFFQPDAIGNEVRIEHADGIVSIYHNLKQGVLVEEGDRVEAGRVIAQAGSSGYSNWPRLGFEVRNADGEPFDPWAGPCSGTRSFWTDQPDYPDRFAVVDAGVTNGPPSIPWVAARPPDVYSFERGKGVGFWVHIVNRPAGRMTLRIRAPEATVDSLAADFEEPRPANDILAGAIILPTDAPIGVWTVEYTHDGEPFVRLEFEVVAPASASPAPSQDPRGAVELKVADDLRLEGWDTGR